MGRGRKKGLTFLLIFISSTLEIVSGEKKNARLGREFNSLEAGTKVGPDQLGSPVRGGSTRINSDRLET